MKTGYLVCYDISDERRLTRVYSLMKQRGIHVQYSVFHCRLTWPELVELKGRLRELIDEKEDDVRVYPLPAAPKVMVLGRGDRVPEGVSLFL
jgi:CRISPR-associated protein Cas2